jgi:multimeric flavodoxin WrbA
MLKIIALSCTQRRRPSLTDAVLSAATEGFLSEQPDADIVPIRLIDYDIKMCEAEDTCLDTDVQECPLNDDFQEVAAKAFRADAMILCMPVYGGNVPAVLKIFQERLKSFMNRCERPFGGLSVCTIVHARTMMTESAMGALSPWYARLKNRNIVSVCFTRTGHEDVQDLMRTKVPDLCFAAGQQLALSFNPQIVRDRPRSSLVLLAPEPKCSCGGQSRSGSSGSLCVPR